MIFVRGMGVLYCEVEHTVIESNYLGVKVQNDETGKFSFVNALDAQRDLVYIEPNQNIKPVEQKMLPRHWQQTYGNGMSMLGFKQRMRADSNKQEHRNSAGARTAERAAMGLHTNQHTIKPETPIETIREKSRSTSIRESSMDRKEKVST